MKHPVIKWLLTISVICCTCGLISSIFPARGRGVFAQTAVGTSTDAGTTDTDGSAANSDPSARVFGVLALLVVCAAVGRFGAKKLKQSPVLGELAVGIVVGAIFYQLGNPTVIIIRHSELIQQTEERSLGDGINWQNTVQSSLRQSGLPAEISGRVERVLLRRDFSSYLFLARCIRLFAGFGIAMLLFMVGLEVSLEELKSIGVSASAVAFLGVSLTFSLACFTTLLLLPKKSGFVTPLFVGAALCASSIGITARIFKDMNRLAMLEARTVLGAAVLDDVLGLIVLAVVTGVATRGAVNVGDLFRILLETVLFLGAVVVLGTGLSKKTVRFFAKFDLGNMKLLYPFVLLMALSWFADRIGLAPIIGAFAAGVIIKEESFSDIDPGLGPEQSVESIHASLEGILAPIFFVLIGIQMDVTALVNVKALLTGLALTAVAATGKLASSLGAGGNASRLIVGIGMLPRVEVALIVASVGKSLRVLDDALYSVIIMVVVLTVLMTPPLLKWSIERKL